MFFPYGTEETEYLKKKDVRLRAVIHQLGHIDRPVDDDLFSSVVREIIGQQISTKAHQTIWRRMQERYGHIDAQLIADASQKELQSLGTTFRKVDYIQDFARKVLKGEFDLEAVAALPDEDAVKALVSLKGIGPWTAEMILLFGLHRPNIFSFGDLAILRGLRMVYHHREITRGRFEKYRSRYTPYCSVASLYLWAVAGGAIPDMKDYAPQKKVRKKKG